MSTEEFKPADRARATARTTKAATATVVDTAKDQFAKVAETHFKAADDAAAFAKSNVEALMQAGSIFYKGFEEITRSFVGITQAQLESGMSAAKAMLGAKTLSEFTDVQNSYAKTAFDTAVSETSHLSELAIKVANQTIEPLNARMTAAIEQLAKPPVFVSL